jgi:hypothetical protein
MLNLLMQFPSHPHTQLWPTSDVCAYINGYVYDDRDVEQHKSKGVTSVMNDPRDFTFT